MGRRTGGRWINLVLRLSSGFSVAYTLLSITGYARDSSFVCHNRDALHDDDNKAPSKTLHDSGHKDTSIADDLAKKVRVLCWVMTKPTNHYLKAVHVKNTWGKRCNVLLFMSTKKNKYLPAIKLPISEGREHLWGKTKAAFQYVYDHHRREADWFMKADDDTYVVVENLRYLLADYNSSDPLYFGYRLKPYIPQGYMSGGAGYVLSREALDRFVNKGLSSPHLCSTDDDGPEDVEMGKCLDNIGVKAKDTRDSVNRGRFFAFDPETHLYAKVAKSFWYRKNQYYKSKEGLNCCSVHAVTFHYITPSQMYGLDYLLYQLRPYGVTHKYNVRPKVIVKDTL